MQINFRLKTDGLDVTKTCLERYKNNPIVLNKHNMNIKSVIGRVIDIFIVTEAPKPYICGQIELKKGYRLSKLYKDIISKYYGLTIDSFGYIKKANGEWELIEISL